MSTRAGRYYKGTDQSRLKTMECGSRIKHGALSDKENQKNLLNQAQRYMPVTLALRWLRQKNWKFIASLATHQISRQHVQHTRPCPKSQKNKQTTFKVYYVREKDNT